MLRSLTKQKRPVDSPMRNVYIYYFSATVIIRPHG